MWQGVTHILCMTRFENDSRDMDCRSFSYLVVGAHDTPNYPVAQHFDEIHDFISRGRSAGAVYVHCMAGISRAATAVLVHLMRSERIPLLIAFRQLKAVRPCVHPNDGFWRALENEERRLLIRDNGNAAATGEHYPKYCAARTPPLLNQEPLTHQLSTHELPCQEPLLLSLPGPPLVV